MIATVTFMGLMLTIAIVVPSVFCICFIGFLIHRDSMNVAVRFSFPRLIPWSIASKVRRVKAEAELAKAQQNLFTEKHQTLQKQIVLSDLETEQYRRALDK